jgi:hypothetical protein
MLQQCYSYITFWLQVKDICSRSAAKPDGGASMMEAAGARGNFLMVAGAASHPRRAERI